MVFNEARMGLFIGNVILEVTINYLQFHSLDNLYQFCSLKINFPVVSYK